jgi:hypothetical protein
MKKAAVVLAVLVVLGTCAGGAVLGCVVYALRASRTFCVASTRASITVDGPRAVLGSDEDLPRPSGGQQLLECPQPVQAPILCRYPAGLGSTYTVRDNGALGITLVGDEICAKLQDSGPESAPQPPDRDDEERRR